MDAAREIPQGVCFRTQPVAVTKVLDDDNLLREIIVRVGFPATLVRASLVCKRWLGHASDPKFLTRFRKLHPPRLLGCYITERPVYSEGGPDGMYAPLFVPMLPQPPELAAVMRRLKSYNFRPHEFMMDCWNGAVFTMHHEGTRWIQVVHRPLCAAETNMQFIPPVPPPPLQEQNSVCRKIISKEEGSSMTYMYVLGVATQTRKYTSRVYMLKDGELLMHTSATCSHGMRFYPMGVHIFHNKIYFPSAISGDITIMDLMTSSVSRIQLPHGVRYRDHRNMLSWADDASNVYLIDATEFQLTIWLNKSDNWLLVDTICLRQMLSTLEISGLTLENEGIANVLIHEVGDNGQFAILEMSGCIFYLDIECRTMRKVCENTTDGRDVLFVHPFMMIWPPTFPALKDDHARNVM